MGMMCSMARKQKTTEETRLSPRAKAFILMGLVFVTLLDVLLCLEPVIGKTKDALQSCIRGRTRTAGGSRAAVLVLFGGTLTDVNGAERHVNQLRTETTSQSMSALAGSDGLDTVRGDRHGSASPRLPGFKVQQAGEGRRKSRCLINHPTSRCRTE
ncbi:hypothetical protein NQZ68_035579 [Dissostichus eleginoides]|nr:hypothetical protein NQZ68_035579 [Dissostichus eleginoides]